MAHSWGREVERGLNDSGEDEAASVFSKGAAHKSRGRRTSTHAHHAWKVHVGVDAPVWVRSRAAHVSASSGARVIVVPPNVEHETGAVGWSLALFIEPGSRKTPYRERSGPFVVEGAAASRAIDACRAHFRAGAGPNSIVEDVVRATIEPESGRLDRRVGAALERFRLVPEVELQGFAAALDVSLDRLTHLVSESTGIPPRRHLLWQRLLRALGGELTPDKLAGAALAAGFTDHAHMTRTFRRFLGRVPSEFSAPPRVLEPWNAPAANSGVR
ncbi:MAG: helix-turn-helix domain-containing protein [Polyangiaceae bacterium]